MKILNTERLTLRWLNKGDIAFIFELVNDPSWMEYIGDKGVKNRNDAWNYIRNGPMAMYQQLGHGLYLMELQKDGSPIGLCGLIKREGLADVDIAYALLPAFCSQGFAYEASSAVLAYGKQALGLNRIVAITDPGNKSSNRLLQRLGFNFEKMIKLVEDAHEVKLFSIAL